MTDSSDIPDIPEGGLDIDETVVAGVVDDPVVAHKVSDPVGASKASSDGRATASGSSFDARLAALKVGGRLLVSMTRGRGSLIDVGSMDEAAATLGERFTQVVRLADDAVRLFTDDQRSLEDEPAVRREAIDMITEAVDVWSDLEDDEAAPTMTEFCRTVAAAVGSSSVRGGWPHDAPADDIVRFRIAVLREIAPIHRSLTIFPFYQDPGAILTDVQAQILETANMMAPSIAGEAAPAVVRSQAVVALVAMLSQLFVANHEVCRRAAAAEMGQGQGDRAQVFAAHGGRAAYGQAWLGKVWDAVGVEAGLLVGMVGRITVEGRNQPVLRDEDLEDVADEEVR